MSISVSDSFFKKIKELSAKTKLKMSTIVELAVEEWFKKYEL